MKLIKFDHNAALPKGVRTQDKTQGVPCWILTLFPTGDQELADGDRILTDDDGIPIAYIPLASYVAGSEAERRCKRAAAEELWADIITTFANNGSLTAAQKVQVFTTILSTIVLILGGEPAAARIAANNTAVAAPFTQAIKDLLLAKIDNAILKL